MDFTVLTEHFVLVVVLACLVVGYIIKHATFMMWLPNNDIPIILAVIGAVAILFASGMSFESAIYGAVKGLASTGMHQAFKKWVENKTSEE